jgi:hypothetical protein
MSSCQFAGARPDDSMGRLERRAAPRSVTALSQGASIHDHLLRPELLEFAHVVADENRRPQAQGSWTASAIS